MSYKKGRERDAREDHVLGIALLLQDAINLRELVSKLHHTSDARYIKLMRGIND